MRSYKTHVPVLDHLRGMAALAVTFFHFTNGNAGYLQEGDVLKQLGSVGWLGVEAFFVISGFVIPYSLYIRAYQPGEFFQFMVRRLKRLEPPYLACIALILILNVLSSIAPGFRGSPSDLTWQALFAHFAYLNAIFDYGWMNPVFWTLAIEFQFYIFVALIFGYAAHASPLVRVGTILIISIAGFLGTGNKALLLHWLPLFAIGIVTFQFHVKLLTTSQYVLMLIPVSMLCLAGVGAGETVVGICTALLIALMGDRRPSRLFRPLALLGVVSYSLYLLHVPIGGRVINLGSRLPDSILYRYPVIVLALLVSIAAAYFFWRYIERPSQRWSKQST